MRLIDLVKLMDSNTKLHLSLKGDILGDYGDADEVIHHASTELLNSTVTSIWYSIVYNAIIIEVVCL